MLSLGILKRFSHGIQNEVLKQDSKKVLSQDSKIDSHMGFKIGSHTQFKNRFSNVI